MPLCRGIGQKMARFDKELEMLVGGATEKDFFSYSSSVA